MTESTQPTPIDQHKSPLVNPTTVEVTPKGPQHEHFRDNADAVIRIANDSEVVRRLRDRVADRELAVAIREVQLGDKTEDLFLRTAERNELRENLEQAKIDELTGLPTRKSFMEKLNGALDDAKRTGTTIAIAFGDLNLLKLHNDHTILKHKAGDNYLKGVARAWEEVNDAGDVLARWGGDEFIKLITNLDPNADLDALEEAITTRNEDGVNAILASDKRIDPTWPAHISVAAAVMRPGESFGDLFQRADAAMDQAQIGYKQTLQTQDPELVARIQELGDNRFGVTPDTAA